MGSHVTKREMFMVWRIVFSIAVAFNLSACASASSYQSIVTSFGQGVLALKGVDDALSSSLSALLASQQDADWASKAGTKLQIKLQVLGGCRQSPSLAADALEECAIVEQGQSATSPSPVKQYLDNLDTAKKYLNALNEYSIALATLSGSTDPDALSKSEQSAASSLTSLAGVIGKFSTDDAAPASAGASLVSALGTAVSFYVNERRNKAVTIAVKAADPGIKHLSKFVATTFQSAQQEIITRLDKDIYNQEKFHIINPGLKSPLNPKEYAIELASLRQLVACANVARSRDAIAAALALVDAHAALKTALQGGGNLSSASQAMTKFLSAAQKALTAFQQLSNDVSGKQSSSKEANL